MKNYIFITSYQNKMFTRFNSKLFNKFYFLKSIIVYMFNVYNDLIECTYNKVCNNCVVYLLILNIV